ncbi:MAG: PPC domain-containing DNA-binding protein [Candidatus Heimdallarchaeota archaeon]
MGKKYVSRFGKSGKVLVARIKPENDLLQSICSLVEKHEVKSGVILSGVGLLQRARLRNCKSIPNEYPITDANRSYLTFEKPLEILALSGNVHEVEGKSGVHAHITLSYVEEDKIGVVGGHLIEGCIVFGFAEIIIMELEEIDMGKTLDAETKTLQLFVR